MSRHPDPSRAAAAALLVALAACTGDGSDVGPRIEPQPQASFRLVVKDDAGRGVASAVVTISGVAGTVSTTRGGRAEFGDWLGGRRRFAIDASAAAAAPGDRLAPLVFAADAQPANQLPFVVHVADTAGSTGLTVTAGVLGSAATLDDTGWSGTRLDLSAGTVIGLDASPATLRTGALRGDHVPPLRTIDGSPAVVTRGILLEPLSATFAPAATLTLPNDIGLPANGSAPLYRLDPGDGEWRIVGTATADATGAVLTAAGAVVGGGLHAVAAPAPATARIVGRAIQEPVVAGEMTSLRGLRVRAGQVVALADGDGRFALEGVPVADAGGTPVDPIVMLAGGAEHRPTYEERTVAAAPGSEVDLGTIESAASFATNVRVLIVERGRPISGQRFSIGSTQSGSGGTGVTDADGRVDLPGVEAGFAGFLQSRPDPRERFQVQSIEGIGQVDIARSIDLQLFNTEQPWLGFGGGTGVWAIDPDTRAPQANAWIFRQRNGGDEFLDVTKPNQIDREELGGSHAILTLETSLAGRTLRSAFEVQSIFVGRIEVPLQSAPRASVGNYEPFGIATGTLGGSTDTRLIASTPIVDADAWLRAAQADTTLQAAVPMPTLPGATAPGAFEIGVIAGAGTVIGSSVDVVQSATVLRDVSFVERTRIPTGVRAPLALIGPLPADQPFVAPAALAGRDSRVPLDAFGFALGIQMPSGHVLDVGRSFAGTASGDDVTFTLPGLAGPLADASHLVLWRGSGADGAATVTQSAYLPFAAPTRPPVPLLDLPIVTAPAAGAQLPVTGFDVEYQLPQGCHYVLTTLRSTDPDQPVCWEALAPAASSGARIRRMPRGPEILVPGHYVLEVTAVRLEPGSALDQFGQDYQAVVARWVGIGPATRGVGATSSVRFDIELVP